MSFKWEFPISISRSWWDSFVDGHSSVDICIIYEAEDHGRFYGFASPHLEELNDPQIVWQRAYALKSMFDACLMLHQPNFRPFNLERQINNLQAENTIQSPERDFLAQPYSPSLEGAEYGQCWIDPFKKRVSAWLYTARFDKIVQNLLLMLGTQGFSYISLYSALDYMGREGWSKDFIARQTSISTDQLKRFTLTANNSVAAGPLARHGEKGWQPPNNPMMLSEATKLLSKVLIKFLNSRAIECRSERSP